MSIEDAERARLRHNRLVTDRKRRLRKGIYRKESLAVRNQRRGVLRQVKAEVHW